MAIFHIKNRKLALLAFIFICLFSCLGYWQLHRAKVKQRLFAEFAHRSTQPALTLPQLNKQKDWRFYRLAVRGKFDNTHTLLLDNKTWHGQIGYEVYTPLRIPAEKRGILIDRGFIQLKGKRNQLPHILPIVDEVTLTGILNQPPTLVAWGKMIDETFYKGSPFIRVEYLDFAELSQLFGYPLYPFVLHLPAEGNATFSVDWKITTLPPERHMGYALQWFALAATLLILFVALNRRQS